MNEPLDAPRDENFAQSLMQDAFACLDRHDLNGATEIARRLADIRHSGSFEIMAEVNLANGNLDKAIELLEDGVKAAPSVWLLWQSLGNARTQRGDFERAQNAYGQALRCPRADMSSIHFNRALAYARDGRPAEALEALDLVTGALLRFKADSFKMAVQNDMHRFDETDRLGRRLLQEEARDAEDRARVHAQLARARLQGYDDRAQARHHAELALNIFPHEPTAHFVIRAIQAVEKHRPE